MVGCCDPLQRSKYPGHRPVNWLTQPTQETVRMSFETPKSLSVRCTLAAVLALSLANSACESEAKREAKAKAVTDRQAYQEKFAKAKALFEERCKTAGVVIHRIVKDVEGIELTKVRQPIPWGGREYFDPMFPEAAMAGENRGDDYIKQFLMYEFQELHQPGVRGQLGPITTERPNNRPGTKKGYAFVEVVDSATGARSVCTPDWTRDHPNWVSGQHRCASAQSSKTRYALDYEDMVDPADRALWVAGTKLKVIDKQTGEVIAQLTRFVWDQGFGGSSTGRWPWQYAAGYGPDRTCPHIERTHRSVSRFFVDTVLLPKQGD